jgi:hypothetical protein
MSNGKHIFTRSLSAVNASVEDGVFRNVSLITCGPCIGHGVMADEVTLRQVMECGKRFKTGVRVNLSHYSGVDASVGYIDNLHISGPKLLGDLHLFPEHKDFALIKKQISQIGDTFGISLYLDGPDEMVNGVPCVRCETLFSADIVPVPSANASGIFSRGSQLDSRRNTATNFMKYTVTPYHLSYRKFRNQGLGRQAALKASQQSDWSAYVSFCKGQESGTVMESLDEPDHERNLSIIRSGRLI